MSTKNRLKPCTYKQEQKTLFLPLTLLSLRFALVISHSSNHQKKDDLHVLDIWISLWFVIELLIAFVTKYSLIKVVRKIKKYFLLFEVKNPFFQLGRNSHFHNFPSSFFCFLRNSFLINFKLFYLSRRLFTWIQHALSSNLLKNQFFIVWF